MLRILVIYFCFSITLSKSITETTAPTLSGYQSSHTFNEDEDVRVFKSSNETDNKNAKIFGGFYGGRMMGRRMGGCCGGGGGGGGGGGPIIVNNNNNNNRPPPPPPPATG